MSDVQTKVSITPVVQGGSGARSELAALWQEFKNGKMSVEEFNDEMRNLSGSIYAQRRAVMLMRTEYRNQRAALYEAMRGFRAVAQIGRTITSTYLTYTMMQTRVADRTRDVRDTQEDLASVQERRIRVVKDLGANNSIAMRLMSEEERLTERLAEERRGLKRAQDQNIIGYSGIVLHALQVIPSMVALNRHIDLTKLYMGETWSYTGLSGIVTSAASAEVAILGVKTTYGTLASLLAIPLVIKVGFDVMQDLADKVNEQLEEAGLPITEKKPGDPDMKPLWPGVWVDEGLLEEYPSDKEIPWEPGPEFGGGGGVGGGGGGARTGGDINVTVEEGDVDVEVDVTVTRRGSGGGGESRHR